MVDLSDLETKVPNDVPMLKGDGEAVEAFNNEGRSLLRRLAGTVWEGIKPLWGPIKFLFRLGIDVGAFFMMYEIVTGVGNNITPEELGTAVCTFAMAGLSAVGKLVNVVGDLGQALRWGFTEGKVYKAARSWFSETAKPGFVEPASFTEVGKAFVGDFGRLARTLGLIGCVLNLITSFDDMSASGTDSDDPVAARERLFAKVNFSLGVVEGVACVGSIVAKIAGFETLGAVCGPIGMIVGVAALVVSLVDMFEDPPDVWMPLEDWLDGDPTTYMNYDPTRTFTGKNIITYPLPSFVGVEVPVDPSKDAANPSNGNQNQDNKNNDNGNNDNGGNSNTNMPGPKKGTDEQPRKVTVAQEVAARNLSTALQSFIGTALGYEPGCPAVMPTERYQNEVDEYVRHGLLWARANLRFIEATNALCVAIDNLLKQGLWCVQQLNNNLNNEAVNPFDQILDAINDCYNKLVNAMATNA